MPSRPAASAACWTTTAIKQNHLARPTWGAEICQLTDGCDLLLLLAGAFYELRYEDTTVKELRDRVEGRAVWHEVPLELHACVGAQSVFAGITAESARLPAEGHTLDHDQ